MQNRKDVSVMLKEAGILFAITLLAGLLLGLVFEITKAPRQVQKEKAIEEACKAVFESAGTQNIDLKFEAYEVKLPDELVAEFSENGVTVGTIYKAMNADSLYGYVVEATSSKGYSGDIVLYVGVDTQSTVTGVSITQISETAGLGMEAPNVLTPQYANKQVEEFRVTKTGASADDEVDAISSATKTSRAVTNAVNAGLKTARTLLNQGGAANE